MTSATSIKVPLTINGGCLCNSIRYSINIPAIADWPPSSNSTCQCTQCRKFTGALIPHGITFLTSYFSPSLHSNPDLKSYQVTEKSYRSFCHQCGSSMAFNDGKVGEVGKFTEIYVGTLDEECLGGELGQALGTPLYHCWLENAVEGVTDKFEEPGYTNNRPGK